MLLVLASRKDEKQGPSGPSLALQKSLTKSTKTILPEIHAIQRMLDRPLRHQSEFHSTEPLPYKELPFLAPDIFLDDCLPGDSLLNVVNSGRDPRPNRTRQCIAFACLSFGVVGWSSAMVMAILYWHLKVRSLFTQGDY